MAPVRPIPVTITGASFTDTLTVSSNWESLLINRGAILATTVRALAATTRCSGGVRAKTRSWEKPAIIYWTAARATTSSMAAREMKY